MEWREPSTDRSTSSSIITSNARSHRSRRSAIESSFSESLAKADARTGKVGRNDIVVISGPRSSVVRTVCQSNHIAITPRGYTSPVLLFLCLIVDAVRGRLAAVFPFQVRPSCFLLCCGLPLLWLMAGCDLPKRPPLKADRSASVGANGSRQAAEEEPQIALEAPGAVFEGDWETWDAYFIKDRQVGYSHTQATFNRLGVLRQCSLQAR